MMTGTAPCAFVAGATGYVGREVVRQLVKAGVRTVAHVRPDAPDPSGWTERFAEMGAEVDTTPWRQPDLTETIRRLAPDRVFCLIGTTRSRMGALKRTGGDPRQASYLAVDFGLTALLVEAAAQSGTRPRFVYLSALGAGPRARGAYLEARTKAEQSVMNSGLPYVILRPAIITGPDREEKRTGEKAAACALDALLAGGKAMGLGEFWRRYRSITATDLARALVSVSGSPEFENRIVERAEFP